MRDAETRKEMSDLHEHRRGLEEQLREAQRQLAERSAVVEVAAIDALIEKAAVACEFASTLANGSVGDVIDRRYGLKFAADHLRKVVRKEMHALVKRVSAEGAIVKAKVRGKRISIKLDPKNAGDQAFGDEYMRMTREAFGYDKKPVPLAAKPRKGKRT